MKIVKLTAENVKRLKAVEISPDGAVVEVTGPNGSGKTSVLDAIYFALAGGDVIPSHVVRQGEEKAFVKLDLGEIVVTRKFSANGNTTLVVEAANGAKYPSPQRMLDDLVGSLSFDPLEFVRMDPREQLDALRRVVKLDVDVDSLDAATKLLVESRTVVNRELRQLESQLAAAPLRAEGTPSETVNVTELMDEIQDANERNALIEKETKAREDRRTRINEEINRAEEYNQRAATTLTDAKERCSQIMEEARKQSELWVEKAAGLVASVDDAKNDLAGKDPLLARVETGPLVQRVREAEGVNKAIAQREAFELLKERIVVRKRVVHEITSDIDDNAKQRAEAIARAAMPVEGLSFGEGEVVYGGLPLGNASSAEQLRVSVGVAMAANPKLRILRVRDGSLLDDKSMELLASLVAAGNFQLWIERVEEPGQRPCVVMEDGHVRTTEEKNRMLAAAYGVANSQIQAKGVDFAKAGNADVLGQVQDEVLSINDVRNAPEDPELQLMPPAEQFYVDPDAAE